jgi:FkbM family methyltransferase
MDKVLGADSWQIACFYQTELEIRILEQLLRHSGTDLRPVVLDIGSNIGQYSYYLSKYVRPRGGMCIGFEPRSDLWPRLIRNVRQNNFTAERLAISDQDGTALLSLPENHCSSAIVSDQVADVRSERVQRTTLDSYVQEKGLVPITFVKIDVEGHEPEVLGGAQCVLEEQLPVVLCELENRHLIPRGHTVDQVIKHMSAVGYECFVVSRRQFSITHVNNISIPDGNDGVNEYYFNYWFVPRNDLERAEQIKRILTQF